MFTFHINCMFPLVSSRFHLTNSRSRLDVLLEWLGNKGYVSYVNQRGHVRNTSHVNARPIQTLKENIKIFLETQPLPYHIQQAPQNLRNQEKYILELKKYKESLLKSLLIHQTQPETHVLTHSFYGTGMTINSSIHATLGLSHAKDDHECMVLKQLATMRQIFRTFNNENFHTQDGDRICMHILFIIIVSFVDIL